MSSPAFKYYCRDSGNCRDYYHLVNDSRQRKSLYCTYDGSNVMYTCSLDGEPSNPIGNKTYSIYPDVNINIENQ